MLGCFICARSLSSKQFAVQCLFLDFVEVAGILMFSLWFLIEVIDFEYLCCPAARRSDYFFHVCSRLFIEAIGLRVLFSGLSSKWLVF